MKQTDLQHRCCTETGQIPATTGACASSASTRAQTRVAGPECSRCASSCSGAMALTCAAREGMGLMRRNWTSEEIARIHAEFGFVPTKQLAHALGRSVGVVGAKAAALGLTRRRGLVIDRVRRLFADTQGDTTAPALAKRLGVSPEAVHMAAKQLVALGELLAYPSGRGRSITYAVPTEGKK